MKNNTMTLNRFSCKTPCRQVGQCGHLPMELVRFVKNSSLDILFLTEFPGKNEISAQRFLTKESRHGAPFHTIIKLIEDKYGTDWSYGICGLFKALVSVKEEENTNKKEKKGKKKKERKKKGLFHLMKQV